MGKVVLPNDILLDEVARLLSEGRDVVMTPKGRSMLPFIRGEVDCVVLRQLPKVEVGDIVLAHFGNQYVLHRVVAVEDEDVVLMGDGNLQGVEKGRVSEVCGTVIEIVRQNGKHCKPTKGRLWRKLLPVRKYLLKIYRKWNKLRTSSRVSRLEAPSHK